MSKNIFHAVFIISLFFVPKFLFSAAEKPTSLKPAAMTVIAIDGIAKEYNPNAPPSCQVQAWGNKKDAACKCCLFENASNLGNKKPSEIVNQCIFAQECDGNSVEALLKREKIANDADYENQIRNLILKNYDNTNKVKEINASEINFDVQGFFSEKSVADFLAFAYKIGELPEAPFMNSNCLSVKDIIGSKGYQTMQLFLVSSSCTGSMEEFILKESKTGTKEILLLENSFLLPELQPYIYPKKEKDYPVFFFPSYYFSYPYANKQHYLALMPKASGTLMTKLAQQYKNNVISKKNIENAYYSAGKALSNFHQKFLGKFSNPQDTLIHGDFHQDNIFFDQKTNELNVIDNEKLAQLSPGNPFYDIKLFFFTTINLFLPPAVKNDKSFFNDWLYLTIKSFIAGYADAYKQNRNAILEELYNQFQKTGDSAPYKDVIDKVFSDLSADQ